jgi:hypothetical protein
MNEPRVPARVVTAAELAEPTPSQTVNVGELAGLFRAAADFARAERPIVLHGSTAAPAHPGIDVTMPGTSPAAPTRGGPPHRCGRFTEAQTAMLAGLFGSALSLLDTAATGSRIALAITALAALATVLCALVVAVEIRGHRNPTPTNTRY